MCVVEQSGFSSVPSGLSESEWERLVRACAEVPDDAKARIAPMLAEAGVLEALTRRAQPA